MYKKPPDCKIATYSNSWNYHESLENKPRNKLPTFGALALLCIVIIVIVVVLTNSKDGKINRFVNYLASYILKEKSWRI